MTNKRETMCRKKYKVGLIGLGPIVIRKYPWEDMPASRGQAPLLLPHPSSSSVPVGEVVKSHAWAIDRIPELDIVAVCDLNPGRIDRWNENWGDRWPEARPYSGYGEMLSYESLDVVVVGTSEFLHADPTIKAAESGVRGILCEKPLAASLEDADRMIDVCQANNVILNVEYTRRWTPLLHGVRDAIRSGAIGVVCSMSGAFGGTMGWLFRTGSHVIDTMCFFAESNPAEVFAQLEDGYDDWDSYKGIGGGNQTERDPGAIGYILFENGIRGFFSCMKDMTDIYRTVTIVGTAGYITFDMQGQVAELYAPDPASPMISVRREIMSEPVRFGPVEVAHRELIDNIENHTVSVSPATEARKSVQIMMGFLNSHQKDGRLVDVPR